MSGKIHNSPDKGEVPIVPKVDIDRTGSLDEEEQQIDTEAHRDDKSSYSSIVGNSGRCRPAHVKDLKLKIVDFDDPVKRGAKTRSKKGGNY